MGFSCTGALSALNSAGLVVPGVGGSGYSLVLKATDGGSGGKNDKFSALIKSPAGSTIHNLSGSGGSQLALGGGNITVQQK
jgi:hypothetical protein